MATAVSAILFAPSAPNLANSSLFEAMSESICPGAISFASANAIAPAVSASAASSLPPVISNCIFLKFAASLADTPYLSDIIPTALTLPYVTSLRSEAFATI